LKNKKDFEEYIIPIFEYLQHLYWKFRHKDLKIILNLEFSTGDWSWAYQHTEKQLKGILLDTMEDMVEELAKERYILDYVNFEYDPDRICYYCQETLESEYKEIICNNKLSPYHNRKVNWENTCNQWKK